MYSIGEFSQLCQVTAKTLRHYDSIGLLKPARQDESSGYRFYESGQLQDMMLILKLKQYGFSLEEIGGLLHAEATQLRYMLGKKLKAHTEQHRAHKALLREMKDDIKKLEKGKSIMDDKMDVKIVERKDTEVVSVRETIAIKDFDKLFGKLTAKIKQVGATCVGAPYALYPSMEFDPNSTEVEVGMPVKDKGADTHTMPGGTCAMVLHKGAYSTLNAAYTQLAMWIEESGKKFAGAPYEIYLNDPADTKEEDLLTEIYFPIQ